MLFQNCNCNNCNAKMSLGNCQLSNCNAWDWWHEHVPVSLSVSFSPHVICNHVTFCKHVCKICYLLFVICTAKKSFSETVILLYCNAWCWCHWPVPVTFLVLMSLTCHVTWWKIKLKKFGTYRFYSYICNVNNCNYC